MTELRTNRLILRRARSDDLGAMHNVFSDEQAMRYWSHGPHEHLARTKKWLDSMIDAPPEKSDDFIIELDGEAIGKLGAWRLPEIGFIIGSAHWGKGFAAEALRAFLDHVFRVRSVEFLTADTDPRNAGSLRLLSDHGFVQTGYAVGAWNTHIGVCDSVYLRLEREAWASAS